MAVADTARLIASLELQDKFSHTASTAGRSMDGLERKTGTLGKVTGELGRGLNTAGKNLAVFGVAAAVGIGAIAARSIQAGIASLQKLEEVTVATNTVIESTGGIAGVTADQVRNLAEKYEGLNATMDDKVIQSGENLLLTFTKITEKAFEPALQAALDMNEAMGGGEEGLQGTIIQLGKALNDPIKGATALRRVGVTLTEQQQDQIKALVEANDLYGAQKIILDELSTEFGGRFAAAGDTATGKFAKLQDAIEDAQVALATAFLPLLEKVADKLSTFLSDPKVLAQIQTFGGDIANVFDDLIEFSGQIDWAVIGTSLQIAGTGAKILLQAFLDLPPWVQTAVITGWGLNKLTGGALGNIVGTLASGLIKGVLGINAGVVNVNGAVVNAPGGAAGAAQAGGGLLGFLGSLGLVGTGALVGGGVATAAGGVLSIQDIASGTREGIMQGFLAQGIPGLIGRAGQGVVDAVTGTSTEVKDAIKNTGMVFKTAIDPVIGELKQGRADQANHAVQAQTNAALEAAILRDARLSLSDTSSALASIKTQALLQSGKLDGILAKDTTLTANITIPVNTYVNASLVGQQIVSQQISAGVGSGPGGPSLSV